MEKAEHRVLYRHVVGQAAAQSDYLLKMMFTTWICYSRRYAENNGLFDKRKTAEGEQCHLSSHFRDRLSTLMPSITYYTYASIYSDPGQESDIRLPKGQAAGSIHTMQIASTTRYRPGINQLSMVRILAQIREGVVGIATCSGIGRTLLAPLAA